MDASVTVEHEPREPERLAADEVATAVHETGVTPDVIGLGLVDAHRMARRHGLRLTVSVWQTKIGPWGMVLSQQPAQGSGLRPGAHIHVVAAGRPYLAVPDVCGLEESTAMQLLRSAGLRPETIEPRVSRTVPLGHVIATRPRSGTLVVDGTGVAVVLSRAPTPRRSVTMGG